MTTEERAKAAWRQLNETIDSALETPEAGFVAGFTLAEAAWKSILADAQEENRIMYGDPDAKDFPRGIIKGV